MLPSLIRSSRGRPEILVVHRDLNDQAQVGLDHVVAGRLVPAPDPLCQGDLLFDGQEGGLSDFLEIDLEIAPLEGSG
jgi:hypothetical protein